MTCTSTPGLLSSQSQTSAFATISPTVTNGNVRVGTLSRSGITAVSGRRQALANALGCGLELEDRAGDVLQQLVGSRLLALRPELAQKRPCILAREPRVPELLAQIRAQLSLERPRA